MKASQRQPLFSSDKRGHLPQTVQPPPASSSLGASASGAGVDDWPPGPSRAEGGDCGASGGEAPQGGGDEWASCWLALDSRDGRKVGRALSTWLTSSLNGSWGNRPRCNTGFPQVGAEPAAALGGSLSSVPPRLTHVALEAIVPEKGPFLLWLSMASPLSFGGKQGRTSWVRLMGLLAYGQHS